LLNHKTFGKCCASEVRFGDLHAMSRDDVTAEDDYLG
jgi:hypothetical protein